MKLLGAMHAEFACQFVDGEHVVDQSSSASLSQHFDGFQTIRTLEMDVYVTDLATPKIFTYVENTIKNEIGTTEDERKPVKEKLEKMQRAENTENGEIIGNPLEHYAFDTKTTILKDRRTSLWELFQKTKTTEKKTEPIIKILKRSMTRPSLKNRLVAPIGAISSASANEKLHKFLHMLHRVHPEASAISQKSQNLWKYVTNSNFRHEETYINTNQMLCDDIIIFPCRTYDVGDTNSKRECWIKSDAEYLILELKKTSNLLDLVLG